MYWEKLNENVYFVNYIFHTPQQVKQKSEKMFIWEWLRVKKIRSASYG
jgi:hypothetical protein